MGKKSIRRITTLVIAAVLMVFSVLVCNADSFTWNTIRKEWTYKEAQYPDGVYRLALHANEDAWAGFDRSVKRLRPTVGEDYEIETKITPVDSRLTTGCHFGLVIYKDSKNWLLWGQLNGERTTAQAVIDGVGYELYNVYTVFPYLKIVKEGNRYTFSCSEDGLTWVSMPGAYIDINNCLTDARYGIMAKSFEAYDDFGPTYNIQFDYFYETQLKSEE